MSLHVVSKTVDLEGLKLHYRECGSGPPVLLLHGWPTSSYLWRSILPKLGETSRAIALDLPGFGDSDKPLDASYSFRFHGRVLDGFLAKLGIGATGLVVHDLGGPIGVHWACQNPARVTKLAMLNTVLYPQLSWAVVAFVAGCRLPGVSHLLTSPYGLRKAMLIGVADRSRLSEETIRAYQAPFRSAAARKALLKAGYGLHPKGMAEIQKRLPSLPMPLRIVYGERDRILPDVATTMRRATRDLPQAVVTSFPDCGHFLQEERPEEIGSILEAFFR